MLKDKKIEVLKLVPTKDKIGNSIESYEPRGKYWAYSRLLSMDEYQRYGLDTLTEERIFILNYHPEILPTDRLRYRGKTYKITQIDSYEDYRTDVTIYAERVIPGGE